MKVSKDLREHIEAQVRAKAAPAREELDALAAPQERRCAMKRITLNRNGQESPRAVEAADLKAGRFQAGEHVMLGITGDCCYHRKGYEEFEVIGVEPCDRFGGGRETVTFQRVTRAGKGKVAE